MRISMRLALVSFVATQPAFQTSALASASTAPSAPQAVILSAPPQSVLRSGADVPPNMAERPLCSHGELIVGAPQTLRANTGVRVAKGFGHDRSR